MLSIIKSITLHGLEGFIVDVQVDVAGGIPCCDIVGLPDISIRESKERVRAAIKNSGYEFPSRRIVINLAPATIKKEGSAFDLPIAIAILMASGCINEFSHEKVVFLGELSLDGNINGIQGILPMCIEAKRLGIKKIVVPKDNVKEASVVSGIEVIPVNSLNQVVAYLNGQILIKNEQFNFENLYKCNYDGNLDFSEVKGQKNIKRAIEVAASGAHNCLLIGSPGSGKTMMARRIPTILPNLSFDESLEVTKIHSIAGNITSKNPFIVNRPFRYPHHTISKTSLVGGGKIPKPGEISLAHYGVLFLDELPEFDKSTIEVLRGPLEDGKITISRVNAVLTYPCKFMLVASMNPCPCGYYGSDKECNCSSQSIKKYIGKISGPLLDRIDIQVEVSSVKYENLNSKNEEESSAKIRKRVEETRKIQLDRYKEIGIFSNSELTPKLIEKYCKLDSKCKEILEKAFDKLGLSARAYGRILKVARTIADMEKSENIKATHLLEAIQYRSLDKKYSK
ncbi:MAG: YifB family Mg chelatase-like AAA ATPase [Clostridia bacterium]|nr:YifB family Mg chelatase-like AAA ATPase [Clostridia bacterium]